MVTQLGFLTADDRIADQQLMALSVRHLGDRMPEVVATFYGRLFATEPALRDMFPDNMGSQHEKLLDAVSRLVMNYTDPRLEDAFHKMGRRHATYGVNILHYALVGETLLGVLETYLGDDPRWPEMKGAWLRGYQCAAGIMMWAGAKVGPAHIVER